LPPQIVFVNYSVPNVPKTKRPLSNPGSEIIVSKGWMEPIEAFGQRDNGHLLSEEDPKNK
jgi:hypothetical protein